MNKEQRTVNNEGIVNDYKYRLKKDGVVNNDTVDS